MLESLLQTAASHPWYRSVHGGNNLSGWPILTKQDLYQRLQEHQAKVIQGGSIYYSRSGGTSGSAPLYFPSDVRENHAQRAAFARHLKNHGVLSSKTIAVNICPVLRMYRAMEIFNEYCDHCDATVLPMGGLASDEEVYEQAKLFGANTLIGMPSRLIAFARYVQEKNLQHNFDTVFFGGEFLQPAKRELLQSVFQVKRFAGAYGSAELGVIGWNAALQELPIYHFPKDLVRVEIVPVAGQGYGELVVTNLMRHRIPLIRYATGDLARITSEGQENITVQLLGRRSDSFQMGDDYYNLSDFSDILRPFAAFQIVLSFDKTRQADVVRFCLVEDQPLSSVEKEKVRESLAELFLADRFYYHLEVDFVRQQELIVSPGSLKIPAVLDRRGL